MKTLFFSIFLFLIQVTFCINTASLAAYQNKTNILDDVASRLSSPVVVCHREVWGCSNDVYVCQEKPSIKYQDIDIKNMCVKLVFKHTGGEVCGQRNDDVSRSWVVTRC